MELSAKTKELQNEIKKNEILNDELLTFKANLEEKFIRNEVNFFLYFYIFFLIFFCFQDFPLEKFVYSRMSKE